MKILVGETNVVFRTKRNDKKDSDSKPLPNLLEVCFATQGKTELSC